MKVLNENGRIPIQILLKFVPKSLIDYKASIGSGNGLVPNRRQAIAWTNDDPVHWHIYAALGGNELKIGHQDSSSNNGYQGDISYSASSSFILAFVACSTAHKNHMMETSHARWFSKQNLFYSEYEMIPLYCSLITAW